MALDLDKLVLVGPDGNSGSGRTWRYKTEDNHATVDTLDYFADASTQLKVTDFIDVIVVTNIDASNEAVATYGRHIVNAVTVEPASVDVSDVTVGTVADAD